MCLVSCVHEQVVGCLLGEANGLPQRNSGVYSARTCPFSVRQQAWNRHGTDGFTGYLVHQRHGACVSVALACCVLIHRAVATCGCAASVTTSTGFLAPAVALARCSRELELGNSVVAWLFVACMCNCLGGGRWWNVVRVREYIIK